MQFDRNTIEEYFLPMDRENKMSAKNKRNIKKADISITSDTPKGEVIDNAVSKPKKDEKSLTRKTITVKSKVENKKTRNTKNSTLKTLKKAKDKESNLVKKVGKITSRSEKEKPARKTTNPALKKATTKKEIRKKTVTPVAKTSVQRIVVERALARSLENLKEKVEASKFFTPVRTIQEEHEVNDLPKKYGICRIVCLVRDPYWIHTYWEITEERLREAEHFFGNDWNQTKTILRVHDITGVTFNGENSRSYFDIDVTGGAESWYINVNSPNTAFAVEIARIAPNGKIFILARSNYVTTPRDGMSDILDEEWMSLDFDKMYALSGGFKIGATSAEMNEMMRQRLKSDISSWGGSQAVSSFGGSPVAVKRRGFWFMLDCELIVYGATEPDAKVTMQGHPVNLRPDGTFTVRFALPDGRQEIETTATSADGVEVKTITPIVSRRTESESKILKEI